MEEILQGYEMPGEQWEMLPWKCPSHFRSWRNRNLHHPQLSVPAGWSPSTTSLMLLKQMCSTEESNMVPFLQAVCL